MNPDQTIRGYRVLGERKKDRTLSVDYLLQSHDAAVLQRELWKMAPGGTDPDTGDVTKAAPCVEDDRFTSDDLPTDREAEAMCAGCPLATFQVCDRYRNVAHPAWGVWAGKVHGRALAEKMADDE